MKCKFASIESITNDGKYKLIHDDSTVSYADSKNISGLSKNHSENLNKVVRFTTIEGVSVITIDEVETKSRRKNIMSLYKDTM